MDCENLFEFLLKWIRTFDVAIHVDSVQQLSDGIIFAKVLNSIDANHFNAQWMSSLKSDGDLNWRIKASNLKKILKTMTEYYAAVLYLPINEPFVPDLNAIAEKDSKRDLCRFLQLILCLAIKSPNKEPLIAVIMELENTTKQALMEAIQAILDQDKIVDSSDLEDKYAKAITDYRRLETENETLAQRCHDLERQMSHLREERNQFQLENETLLRRVGPAGKGVGADAVGADVAAGGSSSASGGSGGISEAELDARLRHMQEQIVRLKEENYRLESLKDDMKSRLVEMEEKNSQLKTKHDALMVNAEEMRQLRDEIDVLKERNEQLQIYEQLAEKLKKRLEETEDLQVKLNRVEEKNASYLQKVMELEEELSKTQSVRNQLEMLRGQSSDQQCKMADLVKRADKAEFDCKRAQEKLQAAQSECERLRHERNELKEHVEELEAAKLASGVQGRVQRSLTSESLHGLTLENSQAVEDVDIDPLSLSALTPEVRERVIRMQHEMKRLRLQQQQPTSSAVAAPGLDVSAFNKLQEENRSLYQSNLRLQAQVEDLQSGTGDKVQPSRATKDTIVALQTQVDLVTTQLSQLREEKDAMEAKYLRYLEKAKLVIRQLHLDKITATSSGSTAAALNPQGPTGEGAQGGVPAAVATELKSLRDQLAEKNRFIAEMEAHYESTLKMREEEEKMFIAAWYNLGMHMNRQAAEDRLKKLSSSSGGAWSEVGNEGASPGQSFLAKQRLAHLNHSKVGGTTGSQSVPTSR